jgi:polyhydroxyalkanoate synthesis regulator phasin
LQSSFFKIAMTTNPVFESLHQGFRLTVGAAATLLETLQDPRKRADTLADLQTHWNQIASEWSEKGQVTELEARQFLEEWLNRRRESDTIDIETAVDDEEVSSPTDSNVTAEIKRLTEQLTALRAELERSRQAKS